jgi:hypothetical protein
MKVGRDVVDAVESLEHAVQRDGALQPLLRVQVRKVDIQCRRG